MSLLSSLLPSGRPVTAKSIHPNNAYLVRVALEQWDPDTNRFVPFTSAAVSVTFALDAVGTLPITGLANIAVPAANISTQPGLYGAVIAGATTAALLPYVGQTIFQLVSTSTGDLLVATPLVVRRPRYAQ